MLEINRESAKEFESLTTMQVGWDFKSVILSRPEEASHTILINTGDIALTEFLFNVTCDKRLHSRPGYYTFGILQPDCVTTWIGNQTIPSTSSWTKVLRDS
ncbi:MAG: hypothetical protein GY792_06155 [Gammaproteobacteria bacterium]|nr:hypothetical protein [Gammaproteobacteria bacterium]